MQKQSYFVTSDVFQAAALCLVLQTEPVLNERKGMVYFAFSQSDVLYRALADINSGGAEGSYLALTETVKRLKVLMYQKKAEGVR